MLNHYISFHRLCVWWYTPDLTATATVATIIFLSLGVRKQLVSLLLYGFYHPFRFALFVLDLYFYTIFISRGLHEPECFDYRNNSSTKVVPDFLKSTIFDRKQIISERLIINHDNINHIKNMNLINTLQQYLFIAHS
jgi:hypothetical protein